MSAPGVLKLCDCPLLVACSVSYNPFQHFWQDLGNPKYTFDNYLQMVLAIFCSVESLHIHMFSSLICCFLLVTRCNKTGWNFIVDSSQMGYTDRALYSQVTLSCVDFNNSCSPFPLAERVRKLPRGDGLLREDRQGDWQPCRSSECCHGGGTRVEGETQPQFFNYCCQQR